VGNKDAAVFERGYSLAERRENVKCLPVARRVGGECGSGVSSEVWLPAPSRLDRIVDADAQRLLQLLGQEGLGDEVLGTAADGLGDELGLVQRAD